MRCHNHRKKKKEKKKDKKRKKEKKKKDKEKKKKKEGKEPREEKADAADGIEGLPRTGPSKKFEILISNTFGMVEKEVLKWPEDKNAPRPK